MLPLITLLALKIPGSNGEPEEIIAPKTIPSGGLQAGGGGATAIQNGITIFLITTAILALFFLIFGGLKWIMSGGDKSKIDSARKTILYAIIGLVLTFLSFIIINFVGQLFGLELLQNSRISADCSNRATGPC